jgi:hypothetical protein
VQDAVNLGWKLAQVVKRTSPDSLLDTYHAERHGPLAGKTVYVNWYLKREGILDMSLSKALDYYLVLTGPRLAAASSKGGTRPWRIDAVYLFNSDDLLADLIGRDQGRSRDGCSDRTMESR